MDPSQLLTAHGLVRGRDVGALDACLAEAARGWPVERRTLHDPELELDYRHVALQQVEVALLGVTGGMTVRGRRPVGSPYLLQIPLTEGFDLELDGRSLRVDVGRCALISPPCQAVRRTAPGWTLLFAIQGELLLGRLGLLLGKPAGSRLSFRPLLTSAAAEVREYALLVVEAIDRGVVPGSPAVTRTLESGLVDLLLDLQPHTHSEALVQAQGRSALGRIEAVESHVRADLTAPLALEDLAHVAGCSPRSLQLTFSEHCGMTPLEFVRRMRLLEARKRLRSGAADVSVSRVAAEVGYTSLSRFANHYRQVFAELPSHTLRAARARA